MTKWRLRKELLSSKFEHDRICTSLRERKYKTLEEKNNTLRYYCDEVLTRDIKTSIFVVLEKDEYRFPTLERSIERGKKYYWIHNEFIETPSGLLPKWYLENKSPCS